MANADCFGQIQRLATRLLKGFDRLPYEERLRRKGPHSVSRPHIRADLIAVKKRFLDDWIWTPSVNLATFLARPLNLAAMSDLRSGV